MKWNVGFIGFGMIGKVHAHAYRSLPVYYNEPPGEYNFAAVATSRQETAGEARVRFGFDRATTDWREIVEDPSIQIVHVAQPNIYHREVLLAAMEAGKHIYCEKPLTATWSEAREVEERLPSYRGISQMCLQNRFFAATLKAAELSRKGFLGEVLGFRGVYLHSGMLDPAKILNWKATVQYGGGGVINDLGPHILDLLQLLCGRFEGALAQKRLSFPDRKVRAGDSAVSAPDAEDHAVMLLRLPGGAVGTAEVSKVATGSQDELRFEVHGTGGALRFDLMRPHWIEVFDQKNPDRGWQQIPTGGTYDQKGAVQPKMAVGWVRAHIASLHNFLRAVAEGVPTRPDLGDGIQLQAVLDAVYRSAAAGEWTRVEE